MWFRERIEEHVVNTVSQRLGKNKGDECYDNDHNSCSVAILNECRQHKGEGREKCDREEHLANHRHYIESMKCKVSDIAQHQKNQRSDCYGQYKPHEPYLVPVVRDPEDGFQHLRIIIILNTIRHRVEDKQQPWKNEEPINDCLIELGIINNGNRDDECKEQKRRYHKVYEFVSKDDFHIVCDQPIQQQQVTLHSFFWICFSSTINTPPRGWRVPE